MRLGWCSKIQEQEVQLRESEARHPTWSSSVVGFLHLSIVIMTLSKWDCAILYKFCTISYIDKFLKSKISFLYLHSNHIRSTKIFNYENINGAKGLSSVDCAVS